jgi:16S rRNA (cytidine1402-2'-O)-methyltransferase
VEPGAPGGVLYVIATPIGNDDDLSPRAVRILAECDLIASEDTRRVARILSIHSIRTPTISYFEHNEEQRAAALAERLKDGARIALVSDAGTPAISDPGYRLIRSAHEAGIRVAAVPGPSAAIAALSISGIPTDRFVFEGFLPARRGDRTRALERLARESRTIVLFEAARRLQETLKAMIDAFEPDRIVFIARELTKTHDQTFRGTLREVAERISSATLLGEVTIVIEGSHDSAAEEGGSLDAQRILEILRRAGLSLKEASRAAGEITGISRRNIYQASLSRYKSDRKDS